MDFNQINSTKSSNIFISPTIIWCFLMPLIHFLSLTSNILCIIVFCSKTFIHKPIAIYFIGLLISDSITLLIGYSEMLDRESSMTDKSSLLCIFNGKIIHRLTDFIYTFMGKFCLEWMLYKVLWTRASTILLAILSIQRSRTFFSLSYHETRFCALCACIFSILIALLITCLEWIGIQCEKSPDPTIYIEIFQSITNKRYSKYFYSKFLYDHYNTSIDKYPCIIQSLDINPFNNTISNTNQFNCSMIKMSSEFYSLTQSLISHRDVHISENIIYILSNAYVNTTRLLTEHVQQAKSSDIIMKLFEKRPCHITLMYKIYLKIFDFLHSISFGFNRHTLAIFFGNALPSFIVLLANLLSLKVIYFSKSLKYIKQTTQKNRRHRRLQNDLRAFLVILIESFSVITISWGIPIFLTMYHCQTLYVVSMSSCPRIKKSLAFFLFTDLFNSSTNCLLYSLSGKLFRIKFISIIKIIFTCGKGILWNVKPRLLYSPSQQIELQHSNEHSTFLNCGIHSRNGNCQQSQTVSSSQTKRSQWLLKSKKTSDDNASLSIVKVSDENETEIESVKPICLTKKIKRPQTIKTFLINKLRLFGSRNSTQSRKKTNKNRQHTKTNVSYTSSSSSCGGSIRNSFQRQPLNNQRNASKLISITSDDNRSLTKKTSLEDITRL